jgi:hypothetical protein
MRSMKLPVAKDDHGARPITQVINVRDSASRKGERKSVVTMGFLASDGKPGIKTQTVEFRMGWN